MQKTSKTRILVECALMIALAVVLDILPLPKWAQRRFRFSLYGADCIPFLSAWRQMGPSDRLCLLYRTDDYRILCSACRHYSGFYSVHPSGLCNRLYCLVRRICLPSLFQISWSDILLVR